MRKSLNKRVVDAKTEVFPVPTLSNTVGKVVLCREASKVGSLSDRSIKESKSGSSERQVESVKHRSKALQNTGSFKEALLKSPKHAAYPSTSTALQRDSSGGEFVAEGGIKGQVADKLAEDVVARMKEKIKECHSYRGREALRGALHLLMCDSCGDKKWVVKICGESKILVHQHLFYCFRFHGRTGCIRCKENKKSKK